MNILNMRTCNIHLRRFITRKPLVKLSLFSVAVYLLIFRWGIQNIILRNFAINQVSNKITSSWLASFELRISTIMIVNNTCKLLGDMGQKMLKISIWKNQQLTIFCTTQLGGMTTKVNKLGLSCAKLDQLEFKL